MPNVKIYVDQTLLEERHAAINAILRPLRDCLCAELSVPAAACQLTIIPVLGLIDQPRANMEIQYLATPERTPTKITQACKVFRDLLATSIGSVPAVRATPLDPQTYVALK